MDRDGGSGPKTELDLGVAAAAAVEATMETRGATERDVSTAAQAALDAVRGATELDLSAVAAAAVASLRGPEAPPLVEHKTVIAPPTDTGTPVARKARPNAFAPTAAYSELTADAVLPAPTELDELPEGTLLDNRYHIKALVGQGGMGAVYAAHDDDLDEEIALKVLRPDLARCGLSAAPQGRGPPRPSRLPSKRVPRPRPRRRRRSRVRHDGARPRSHAARAPRGDPRRPRRAVRARADHGHRRPDRSCTVGRTSRGRDPP